MIVMMLIMIMIMLLIIMITMMMMTMMMMTIARSGSLMMIMSGCRPTYYPDLSMATFLVTILLSRSRNGGIDDDHCGIVQHVLPQILQNKPTTIIEDNSSPILIAGYLVCLATKWQQFQLLQFWPQSFSCCAYTSSTLSFQLLGSKSRWENAF